MFAPLLLVFALAFQTSAATAPPADATSQSPTVSPTPAPTPPTPSQPDANDVAKAMRDITPPRLTYQVEPKYTKDARKLKFSGTVVIGLIIDVQGNPTKVHVVRSMDSANLDSQGHAAAISLDQAALDAVSKYRFVPARKNGTPIPVELNVEVNFQPF